VPFFIIVKYIAGERFMDLEDYSDEDLLKSLEAEVAKSLNEIRSAQGDIDKIKGRLRFALAVIHILKEPKD
jgi:hypothetical protein